MHVSLYSSGTDGGSFLTLKSLLPQEADIPVCTNYKIDNYIVTCKCLVLEVHVSNNVKTLHVTT